MKWETIETKDGEAQVAEAETDISDSTTTIVVVSTATFSPFGQIAVSNELDHVILSRRQQTSDPLPGRGAINQEGIKCKDTKKQKT
jgi:hypothetical protein